MLKLVDSSPNNRIIPYEDVYFTGIIAGMYLKLPLTFVEEAFLLKSKKCTCLNVLVIPNSYM